MSLLDDPAPDPAPPPQPVLPTPAWRWRDTIALGAILLVATALGCYRIGAQSVWMDELMSLRYSAGHTLEQIATDVPLDTLLDPPPRLTSMHDRLGWTGTITGLDTHPPLYFVMLRIWRTVFGGSDVAARSMSVVAWLVAIALVFGAAREMYGADGTEIWAALITAVASPAIYYAQEARPYALSLPLALGAVWAVVRMERRGLSILRGAALGGCILALCLTLYVGLAVALAVGGYAVVRLRDQAKRGAIIVLIAAGAVYFVTWGPYLKSQQQTLIQTTEWLREQPDGHVVLTLRRMAVLPYHLLAAQWVNLPPRFDDWSRSFRYLGALMWIVPLVLIVVSRRGRADLLLWYLWLLAAVAMPLSLDFAQDKQHLHWLRFTILAAPALYVLAAAVARRARAPAMRHVVPAIAVLICLWSTVRHQQPYRSTKPHYREMAAVIDRNYQPGDALLIVLPGGPDYRAYYQYLALAHYLQRIPSPAAVLTGSYGNVVSHLRDGRRIWLVLMREGDKPGILPGAVSALDGDPVLKSNAGNLWLARWLPPQRAATQPGRRPSTQQATTRPSQRP
jgi:hypothetical protein